MDILTKNTLRIISQEKVRIQCYTAVNYDILRQQSYQVLACDEAMDAIAKHQGLDELKEKYERLECKDWMYSCMTDMLEYLIDLTQK